MAGTRVKLTALWRKDENEVICHSLSAPVSSSEKDICHLVFIVAISPSTETLSLCDGWHKVGIFDLPPPA
jgi:hypothetical protein